MRTMHWKLWVRGALAGGLLFGGIAGGVWWLREYVERPVVTILASQEPSQGVPVYAQFVVTQRLELSQVRRVSRLQIPLYFPEPGTSLEVTLRRGEVEVVRWEVAGTEITELDLLLPQPQLLDGVLEVELQAPTISAREPERAPRVFVETADQNYPNGNYRIAQNEKQGDVSLTVQEQVQRSQLMAERLQREPRRVIYELAVGLLGLFVVVSLPFARWSGVRNQE